MYIKQTKLKPHHYSLGRGLVGLEGGVIEGGCLGVLFVLGRVGGVLVCWLFFLLFFYSTEKFSQLLCHVKRRGCTGGRPEA